MKKVLGAFFAVAMVLFGSWLTGFDFDKRGDTAFYIFLIACIAAIYGALFGRDFWK